MKKGIFFITIWLLAILFYRSGVVPATPAGDLVLGAIMVPPILIGAVIFSGLMSDLKGWVVQRAKR